MSDDTPEQPTPRATSIDWVHRCLETEGLRGDETLATSLVDVAEQHGVPIEALIAWIQDSYFGKEWTLEACTRWVEKYAEAAERLRALKEAGF